MSLFFCTICKKHFEFPKRKDFIIHGHDDTKVKFLAPDIGRSSKKWEQARG